MTARKGIPPAWEPYLTGQVAAEPTAASWVREQLTLYGILPPETPHHPKGQRSQTTPPQPPPAPPPRLGWPALRQWLDLYTTHLLGLNRAASTLDGYRTDVEQFFAVCERQGLRPPELTRVHLLSHLAALAQQSYQATSRARKTHAIKGCFQFLHEGGALPKHPFATIPSPRIEKRERRVLSEAEYQALRDAARQRSPRDAIVVELLLQTGLRASELCGLRLGDLRFSEPAQHGLAGPGDDLANGRIAQWPLPLGHEHIGRVRILACQLAQRAQFRAVEGMGTGRPLFSAADMQEPLGQVHLVPAQRDQLRDPQAVTVGEQDHRRIAMAVASQRSSGLLEALDFCGCEVFTAAPLHIRPLPRWGVACHLEIVVRQLSRKRCLGGSRDLSAKALKTWGGETYTRLRHANGFREAWRFVEALEQSPRVEVRLASADLERDAWALLREFQELPLSFIEAVSLCLMRQEHIPEAFTFAAHGARTGCRGIPGNVGR